VEPALSQWQQRAQIDKENNRYRQYKHSIKVNAVQTKASAKDRAQVEATVSEVAQVYEKGRLNQADSYNEALRVRYDLVRQGGQWRIQAMKVLK
jgi:lipoate-protein ligase B